MKRDEMTPRQRLCEVMFGRTPDHVPALADLVWWHAAHGGGKFLPIQQGNDQRLKDVIQLHRQTGVAIHLNVGPFFRESFGEGVRHQARIEGDLFIQEISTPVGTVREEREWSPPSWSWTICRHMIQTVEDLKVLRFAYERHRAEANWARFREVDALVGEAGLPFVQIPSTGMGFLISRYAGVEPTVMFAMDYPEELAATMAVLNAAQDRVLRLMVDGPAQVLFFSDNLSSDVQSPPWFEEHSAGQYRKVAKLAHEHGKVVSVHIDGRLRGLIKATADCGIDAADAVTPAPWGDISPQACRDEAGPRYVLSGGIPPDSFAESVPMKRFDEQVEAWLGLRGQSPGLVIAPGDQLPPDGSLDRIVRMAEAARGARFN